MAKKTKKPVREWIGNWTVSYDWEWRGEVLSSRRHDFRVNTTRRNSQWFMFNRHVVNEDNGAIWVDGFDPNGGFVSFRPEQIVAVRPHKEVKKNAERSGRPAGTKPRGRPRKT